jgi:hypothetical protein
MTESNLPTDTYYDVKISFVAQVWEEIPITEMEKYEDGIAILSLHFLPSVGDIIDLHDVLMIGKTNNLKKDFDTTHFMVEDRVWTPDDDGSHIELMVTYYPEYDTTSKNGYFMDDIKAMNHEETRGG